MRSGDTFEALLSMAVRTVNTPLPVPIEPNELADALFERDGAHITYLTYLRAFFAEVSIDLIHRLVLVGGPDFAALYRLGMAVGIDNPETEEWIREMAFIELSVPPRLRK